MKTASASPATSGFKLPRSAANCLTALVCCTSPLALMAQDLPTGGHVAAGQVHIGTPGAAGMIVTQGSDTAIVNWNSFNVGAGATLRFDQPSQSSTILNRVTGDTGTDIHGRLTANGQVHIVNPNGIFIGPNGMVQAGGGFVASTLEITDEDFLNGNYRYQGNGESGGVDNAGTIQIGRGGYAALLGGRVSNAGRVSVPMGRVGFASGERVTLDLSGDGFLQVAVPTTARSVEGEALIENAGTVSAEGGRIEMKAATARHAVRNAINLSGVAEASSLSVRGGTIVLGGGAGGAVTVTGRVTALAPRPRQSYAVDSVIRPQVRPAIGGNIAITGATIALNGATLDVSGAQGGGTMRIGGDFAGAGNLQRATSLTADADTTFRADALDQGNGGRIVLWSDVSTDVSSNLSARGGTASGNGGFVEVSSAQTLQYQGLTDTRAPRGANGMLLLDPLDIIINPGADETTLENNLALGDVTLDTSAGSGGAAGNITINANIDWVTGSTLFLNADNNIRLNGAINGPNGGLYVYATNAITTDANGRVNVAEFTLSGGNWSQVSVLPAFSADDFLLYGGSFLRAASGDGAANPYVITDVYGLQGIGSGPTLLAANYQLGANIDASGTANWGQSSFGSQGFSSIGSSFSGFTGQLDGNLYTISNLFSDQSAGEGGPSDAGLFGNIDQGGGVNDLFLTDVDIFGANAGGIAANNSGTISAVSVTGSVLGQDGDAGGLVGVNYGTIIDSRADVDVSSGISGFFYALSSTLSAGGAIGSNFGTVNRVHAVGNVFVSDDGQPGYAINAGGFVGQNGGTIRNSYAHGAVSTQSSSGGTSAINAGGFAGLMDSVGTIGQSYSTGTVVVNESIPVGTGGGFSLPVVAAGGFAGRNDGTATPSNFWDVTRSGRTSSAAGVGRTTTQLQDTAAFVAFASARGWVFSGRGAVWAPGEQGYYPANYTTSPVIYVVPDSLSVIYGETSTASTKGTIVGGPASYYPANDITSSVIYVVPDSLSVIYGETSTASTTGTIVGGPASYVFDDPADVNFNPSDFLGNLVFGNRNVGLTTLRTATQLIGYAGSEDFTVVDQSAVATIIPRSLTIRVSDASKLFGQLLTFGLSDVVVSLDDGVSPTGLVAGDRVTNITVTSDGAAADADAANSPYVITADGATGTGLSNYTITYIDGALTVVAPAPAPVPTPDPVKAPAPAPAPSFTLPNPADTFSANISLGPLTVASVAGDGGSKTSALEILVETKVIADGLTGKAQSCPSNDQDVSRYLACLSDALNDFAGELDAIVADLSPGLADVARIVQDARQGVDAASNRAQRRLAGATTAAERQAIRNDAINEARATVDTAASEIRKAISLVRVEDPELATIQRETIVTVAAAMDSVSITLSRAVGL